MDEEAIAQRHRSETSKTPRIVAIDTTDGALLVATRSTCRSISNKQQNDRLTDDAAEEQQDHYS